MQCYDYCTRGLNDLGKRQVSKEALKQSSCFTAASPPSLQQLGHLNCSPNP